MSTEIKSPPKTTQQPIENLLAFEAERRISLLQVATQDEIDNALKGTGPTTPAAAYLHHFRGTLTRTLNIDEIKDIAKRWPQTPPSVQRSNTNRQSTISKNGLIIETINGNTDARKTVAWTLFSTRVQIKDHINVEPNYKKKHASCRNLAPQLANLDQQNLLDLLIDQYIGLPLEMISDLLDSTDESTTLSLIDETNNILETANIKILIRNGITILGFRTSTEEEYETTVYNNAETQKHLFPSKKLHKENSDTMRKLAELEIKLATAEATLETEQAKRTKAETALAGEKAQVESLTEKLATASKTLAELEIKLAAAESTLKTEQAERTKTETALAEACTQITDLNKNLTTVSAELEQERVQHAAAKSALAAASQLATTPPSPKKTTTDKPKVRMTIDADPAETFMDSVRAHETTVFAQHPDLYAIADTLAEATDDSKDLTEKEISEICDENYDHDSTKGKTLKQLLSKLGIEIETGKRRGTTTYKLKRLEAGASTTSPTTEPTTPEAPPVPATPAPPVEPSRITSPPEPAPPVSLTPPSVTPAPKITPAPPSDSRREKLAHTPDFGDIINENEGIFAEEPDLLIVARTLARNTDKRRLDLNWQEIERSTHISMDPAKMKKLRDILAIIGLTAPGKKRADSTIGFQLLREGEEATPTPTPPAPAKPETPGEKSIHTLIQENEASFRNQNRLFQIAIAIAELLETQPDGVTLSDIGTKVGKAVDWRDIEGIRPLMAKFGIQIHGTTRPNDATIYKLRLRTQEIPPNRRRTRTPYREAPEVINRRAPERPPTTIAPATPKPAPSLTSAPKPVTIITSQAAVTAPAPRPAKPQYTPAPPRPSLEEAFRLPEFKTLEELNSYIIRNIMEANRETPEGNLTSSSIKSLAYSLERAAREVNLHLQSPLRQYIYILKSAAVKSGREKFVLAKFHTPILSGVNVK